MAQSCKQMEMGKKGESRKKRIRSSVGRQSDISAKPEARSAPRLRLDRRKFHAIAKLRERVN